MMDNNALLIVVIAALVILAVAGWVFVQQRRRTHLRKQFGPEYERALADAGDRRSAERELARREARVRSLEIRPLAPDQRARFLESWRRVQADFVDAPSQAIEEADRLVTRLMETLGYPVADFEQRAADVSVDHPVVVDNYRAARELAIESRRGVVSTESQRQAMVHYRALFEDLLETRAQQEVEVRK
jgi:hypothetical protein